MSLTRLIFYSALLSAWAALVAALVAEFTVLRGGWVPEGSVQTAVIAALVGGALGAALNLVAGLGGGSWRFGRLVPGFLFGALGGALGGWLGNELFRLLPWARLLGWLVLGLCAGAVEGLSERSGRKLRNGLIGGALGGLAGGLLFEISTQVLTSRGSLSLRVTAFVLLGLAIGLLIGWVQVILKDAWITVLDGYRPGRQLILSREATVIGRAEHVALPLLGSPTVEHEHVCIRRMPNGSYVLENLHGRENVLLNNNPVATSAPLKHGDVIRVGSNAIRFEERQRSPGDAAPSPDSRPIRATTPVTTPQPQPQPQRPTQPSVPARQCPGCGPNMPGPVGKRRCLVCQRTY